MAVSGSRHTIPDDNPYRTQSRSYVQLGAMGEVILGKVSLFLNGGLQNSDGSIVLPQGGPLPLETEVPGSVR